jgi:hypothetical protein
MANVGRISGSLLRKNLLRHGEDLAFEDNLLYLSVPDSNEPTKVVGVGIKKDIPLYELDVNGTTRSTNFLGEKLTIDNVDIDGNIIKSKFGTLNFQGATPNDFITFSNNKTFKLSTIDVVNGYSRLDLRGNLEVDGNIHATGSITADGNLVLGDDSTDAIEFKADIVSNIIPDIDDTYDLGTLTQSWRQLYVDDMRLGGPEVGDNYNFAQTQVPGSGTLPAKTFTGIDNPQNYTKMSNTFSNGHLTLASNNNGLIELINDTRVHNDLNVLGDVATDNANYILIGDPEYGILDGAVEMTPQTSLTDGVAQLNLTLTLLVPPAPPSFPNGNDLLISGLTQRILNVDTASQVLNGNTITAPAAGTVVYVARTNSFNTNIIQDTGPGNRGTLTVKRNTLSAVTKVLTYGNSTQVITTVFTSTSVGSQEVRYNQPSAGVLVPGYLIKIAASGTTFGGLNLNDTFIITAITSKFIKMSTYNTVTGQVGTPFVGASNGSGSLAFSTITDVGTYTSNNTNLVLSNNIAFPLTTPGFHEVIDISVNGFNVPSGWNTVEVLHGEAGNTTIGSNVSNIGIWYYDDSSTNIPIFSNQTFALKTSAITYTSTIPHYNSSTVYSIGFDVTWNAGKTGHANQATNILTTAATGPWTNAGNKSYNSFAYTTLPTISNVLSGSGPNATVFDVNVVAGFGAWTTITTVPVYTADNSYTTAQSALPPLNAIILYKTGTTSSTTFLDETNIFFNAAVGGSTTGATRCENPDAGVASTDNPTFTAGSNLFNSQTSSLLATDATVVGTGTGVNSLKHDVTNYSTGYLPAGPNLSTRTAANPQYFTFRFVRSGVSKFRIRWTTPSGIAGIWAAMPGANGTSLKSGHVNGWLSASIDNSLAGGCALGGNLPTSSGTRQVNISFGILSSTNATNNEIWIRIRLNQGQSMTSLYLDVSDQ